jgi:M6 family metalloprotease-like protein
MNTSLWHFHHPDRWMARAFAAVLVCSLLGCLVQFGSRAATLTEFGYRRIDPGSSRPLLVVLGDFDCFPKRRITRSNDYYYKLFFDRNTYPSLNGFFWQNSLGRFQVTPAGPGVVGPLVMTTNESFSYLASQFPADCENLYYSNVIRRTLATKQIDVTGYDKNGNQRIEPVELSWTFMNNLGGGASRGCPTVSVPGTPFSVGSGVSSGIFANNAFITANFTHGDFESTAHEQSHQIGLLDLYNRMSIGCPDGNYTTMTCTVPWQLAHNMDDTNAWYFTDTWSLDPWHRMLLGWCEPRLVSLKQGGRFTLPAAQLQRNDAAILLYDPDAKYRTNDYFLLEYRTSKTKSAGTGYESSVSFPGLVIWHFHPDDPQAHVPFVYTEGPPNLSAGSNLPWTGDSTTPYLKHRPDNSTAARIYVYPFNPDDDSIEIEIQVTTDTYVDFNATFQPEDGSWIAPYNSLAEGVNAASWGGNLYFKGGGHTAESTRIDKATTLRVYGPGSVTLGH